MIQSFDSSKDYILSWLNSEVEELEVEELEEDYKDDSSNIEIINIESDVTNLDDTDDAGALCMAISISLLLEILF
jgi:hypothetical protein